MFASIANYFREYGWETGAPVLAEADLDPDPTFAIDTRNLELERDGGEPRRARAWKRARCAAETPAMLISAEQRTGRRIAWASTTSR